MCWGAVVLIAAEAGENEWNLRPDAASPVMPLQHNKDQTGRAGSHCTATMSLRVTVVHAVPHRFAVIYAVGRWGTHVSTLPVWSPASFVPPN